ncbi:MAG: methyltransferase domain-containing protein [Anaerolineae bacterium]|nr:methyltransferase domain-containing protein [Anaerolineae bacterium]
MVQIAQTERYPIGSDLFVKEYLTDGRVRFWKNGQLLDLEAWNRELNRFQSMAIKERHSNPLVRWQEQHRRQGFLRLVDARPGEIVADVGCESGYMAAALVVRGCHVICIDIDAASLELARQRIGPNQAEYVVSDIQAIQLPDASVDVAVASEVLEHVPAPDAGLRELIRITRPGGRIFLSVPNEPLILVIKQGLRAMRLTRLLGRLSENLAIGHVQVFHKRDLVRLCQTDGVAIRRVAYHKPFCLNIIVHLQRSGQ